ncbi:MAG: metallophosphoesterase, partial [Planctomycetaceae bacterium]|nr:metallophosphoesterase [Planctomycetaceae bacterium]
MRRIFIGDIQGCREELEELLVAVRFDATTDELHPVGDMVNRGPDSLGVLRLLRAAGAGGVLGNHDVHLLRAARGLRKNGKRDTFGDVLAAPERE